MSYEEVSKNEGTEMNIDSAADFKFRRHETFHIRKGWISKGLAAISEHEDLFVSKTINPMDELGIGANMVKSLRYWLQAVGVTEENNNNGRKRGQSITELGKLVLESDPYLEEIATLWVLHYELINGRNMATSWYYLFNEFRIKSFTQNDFVRGLATYANKYGQDKAQKSYSDDFACILKTYLPKDRLQTSFVSPENNIDCPFVELELLRVDSLKEGTYRKRQADTELLPPLIMLYSLLRFKRIRNSEGNELKLEDILNQPGSPGKAFNLDSIALLDMLRKLENHGFIRILRTAGMDTVRIDEMPEPIECLKRYYEEMD